MGATAIILGIVWFVMCGVFLAYKLGRLAAVAGIGLWIFLIFQAMELGNGFFITMAIGACLPAFGVCADVLCAMEAKWKSDEGEKRIRMEGWLVWTKKLTIAWLWVFGPLAMLIWLGETDGGSGATFAGLLIIILGYGSLLYYITHRKEEESKERWIEDTSFYGIKSPSEIFDNAIRATLEIFKAAREAKKKHLFAYGTIGTGNRVDANKENDNQRMLLLGISRAAAVRALAQHYNGEQDTSPHRRIEIIREEFAICEQIIKIQEKVAALRFRKPANESAAKVVASRLSELDKETEALNEREKDIARQLCLLDAVYIREQPASVPTESSNSEWEEITDNIRMRYIMKEWKTFSDYRNSHEYGIDWNSLTQNVDKG